MYLCKAKLCVMKNECNGMNEIEIIAREKLILREL